MGYFPSDIPFMSHDELIKNGINIPNDNPDTHVIKRCPFCGSEAEIKRGGHGGYYIRCSDYSECFCSTFIFNTLDEATRAWNRRSDNV